MKKFNYDVAVIGSGMGSLTTAALLANAGAKVIIFEKNYLPGGCTSSYWRKGFVFESGATTLVGLDQFMPLNYLLEKIGITIPALKLDLPMQVHLANGQIINKYQPIEQWIGEAERVFGKEGQRSFWKECYQISQWVWKTATQQRQFPPVNFKDFITLISNVSLNQFKSLPYGLMSTQKLLKKHGLDKNQLFANYVNEQLLITAQNSMEEVNALFGATALCYTNYGNYYVNGGLINLVNPLISFIESKGGKLLLRVGADEIIKEGDKYKVLSKEGEFAVDYVVSGIPINNTAEIFGDSTVQKRIKKHLMGSEQLWSAFQMGIGFRSSTEFESIHHQIHLSEPLPQIHSKSIFISLNHAADTARCDEPGHQVLSVSTHIADPENTIIENDEIENAIIAVLEQHGFLKKEDIVYQHSSGPKSWQKWTGRAFGFVGGYPQFKHIKPWQMKDARLDGHKAYQVGDTVYPGQGIPGTMLSGIIAFEKMKSDWF